MDPEKLIVCDVECYKNYFLVMFRRFSTGNVIALESFEDKRLDRSKLLHILQKFTTVTFNGIGYDTIMIDAALSGYSLARLKELSDSIINSRSNWWQVRRSNSDIMSFDYDHIDIIQVAPLQATLKIYGGRMDCPKMQDLPIHPDATITEEQTRQLQEYCGNDLEVTEQLLRQLWGEIELREHLTKTYDTDVRSKSDAQIAEAIIKAELIRKGISQIDRMKVEEGTQYRFKCPDNIKFKTPVLQEIHNLMVTELFTVGKSGHVGLPKSLHNKKIKIGTTTYKIGIGGLHSCEKSARHTNDLHILRDYDVASYYPRIILNNSLFPETIGPDFLDIYNSIVERRLKAKREGNRAVNESLKITINGSFGKFGSKWSCMYSPRLVMQVTLTGQLSLLMLIERLEMAGISVVSANTDGIVVKCDPSLESTLDDITEAWQRVTKYELESTDYDSLNSRDVNNYIAVKGDSCKGKGAYTDQSEAFNRLRSNPSNQICVTAVKRLLVDGTPVEKTIRECDDIRQFVTIKTVNGGAVYWGEPLGKAIRWYYGRHELDAIYYATNGNKVARSDGAVPLMELPEAMPNDVDFDWYIVEAKSILEKIGVTSL